MSKPKPFTIQDFYAQFPDDNACLDHLLEVRYGRESICPKCGAETRWYRLSKEPAYCCKWCGWHIHPMVGTPFHRTRTSLQKWFFTIYMFTTTRNGVSAKEIQRQCGVTYKTAWRMGHEIRKYMGWVDGDDPLNSGGIVEVDEVFIGGVDKGSKGPQGDKSIVFGMVERGGDAIMRVVKNRRENTLVPIILKHVPRGTRVATDEHGAYHALAEEGYRHGTVNHARKEYVRGAVHTNTIEGFWAWLQRSILGTHVSVSEKHLPKYLGEFEFRFNLRKAPYLMFDLLLTAFAKPPAVPSVSAQDRQLPSA